MNGDSRLSPPQNQAEAHYKGHKHARKLKAVEAAKSKQRPQTLTQDETAKIEVLKAALREGKRITDTEEYQNFIENIKSRKIEPLSWE